MFQSLPSVPAEETTLIAWLTNSLLRSLPPHLNCSCGRLSSIVRCFWLRCSPAVSWKQCAVRERIASCTKQHALSKALRTGLSSSLDIYICLLVVTSKNSYLLLSAWQLSGNEKGLQRRSCGRQCRITQRTPQAPQQLLQQCPSRYQSGRPTRFRKFKPIIVGF